MPISAPPCPSTTLDQDAEGNDHSQDDENPGRPFNQRNVIHSWKTVITALYRLFIKYYLFVYVFDTSLSFTVFVSNVVFSYQRFCSSYLGFFIINMVSDGKFETIKTFVSNFCVILF